ncbi:DNA-binding MarR family transcriptional regulator [Nocardiopsis sp. Huas11]|uniref:MarR family winged helix-turn-helix transcriptional regulator n=1 Tax=Nocardiopsis sp. Huas11 TaxID=2183912 RepID=UPI000EB4F630|nr:MarR family transcriptional regulator [Nocardiopsis sp. Huas11]RKS06262.1 DNA-binding MarR family transcriptional regulator [Nocardiopsis sp. Huas11]
MERTPAEKSGSGHGSVGADRLGHTIKRAEQALIGRKSRALREFSLTVPQYAVLLLLSVSDGMSAAQLARECMVTPQTMATVLTNLERSGLIERNLSPLHQKVTVNSISDEGRALVARADEAALRVEAGLAAEFTEAELSALGDLLERAITRLNAME